MAWTFAARRRWPVSLCAVLLAVGCAKPVGDAPGPGTGGSGGLGGGADASTDGGAGTPGDAAAGASGTGTGGSAGTSGSGGSAGASGSGGGGTGGSSGGGGSSGAGGSPGDAGACPSLHGPPMVQAAGQCVDSTEVTNADYAAFLAAGVPISGQPSYCGWNASYTPSNGWPATGKDNYPVVYVDWCDAYAYCKWAGKRLCGDVGGGPLAYSLYGDTSSQWFNACSGSGFNIYPYGGTYDPTACNGVDYGQNAAIPVKQASKCEGGWPGVYDMSGNVWEWEDSCQAQTGASDQCHLRGGSFWYNGETDLRCDRANVNDRSSSLDIYGFRCCAP